jgi:predicted alpha/beta hydrolase
MPAPHALSLVAPDGQPLAATLYASDDPKAVVVIAGATAVPQGFYRRFAESLAARGSTAVTFDYRGAREPERCHGPRRRVRWC